MMDRVWVTKDRRSIPVSQMETSHIERCIRLILMSIGTRRPWRLEYLNRLVLEIEIRNMRDRT